MSTREAQQIKAKPKRPNAAPRARKVILYPESDGKPMADNTRQFEWIVLIKKGLDDLFKNDLNVFIAGDLLWYPLKTHPEINTGPDVMVTIGRPKGHRSSYKQWEEEGLAPQVVFEIWSPSNTLSERAKKLQFYDQHGVEEYYNYDPYTDVMEGWLRRGRKLARIADMREWVSPRLQIKFGRNGSLESSWKLFHPDGRPFEIFERMSTLRDLAERQTLAERAAKEAAEQQAKQERTAKEAERAAKEAAWAKLRELGFDPEQL
jgi:Uma2 family endonuclease